MADDITRDLVVYLQSISYSGSTSATLLSKAIPIFIDSTDPNLWLPEDVCNAFENAFDISLDNETGLYLVNDTQNTELLNSNAQVTFRISDVQSGGDAVSITLPYEAFALTAQSPLVENSSYYFPLKRAANFTQYTLGRTFLQEAYLSADYERGVFNVSACKWDDDADQNIVTITSKDSKSSDCSGSECSADSDSEGSSSPLSRGAVAGIAIAALCGVVILAAIMFFFIRRQRQKTANKATPPESDVSVLSGPVHNAPLTESSNSEHTPPRPRFWSPDAVLGDTSESNVGGSSGSGTTHEQSVELDGRNTQIKPVYYELPANGA
ncbi:unnamed protein product [Penicillium bialowiezense]